MEVTNIQISATRGNNKLPSFGYVWFDDGKMYSFSRQPNGVGFRFGSWRSVADTSERFSFASKKREDALIKHLDEGAVAA